MRIYDNSLTPDEPKTPDFKVSTEYYQVENGYDRMGLGDQDSYFWKTSQERLNTTNQSLTPEEDGINRETH